MQGGLTSVQVRQFEEVRKMSVDGSLPNQYTFFRHDIAMLLKKKTFYAIDTIFEYFVFIGFNLFESINRLEW